MMATKEKHGRFKNPALAAFLSFFYMGLGHIYAGEIRKGISLICLYTISLALVPVMVGVITTPMLWVRGIVYAYRSAENLNRQIAGALTIVQDLRQETELLAEPVLAEPLAE